MSNFKFSATLIFRSCNNDLQNICNRLGMEPKRRWIKGQPRTAQKGSQLNGIHEESSCSFYLEPTECEGPCDLLNRVTDKLYSNIEAVTRITQEGGSVECYVAWAIGQEIGVLFDERLLSKMGELRINLSVEGLELDNIAEYLN